MTTRQDLARIKLRALRMRVWFRALSNVERTIIDLTLKCVRRVRSPVLARAISAIVDKILRLLGEDFMSKAEKVGHGIAKILCASGESWGNKTCSTWKRDKVFIRFLGVNMLNEKLMCRSS